MTYRKFQETRDVPPLWYITNSKSPTLWIIPPTIQFHKKLNQKRLGIFSIPTIILPNRVIPRFADTALNPTLPVMIIFTAITQARINKTPDTTKSIYFRFRFFFAHHRHGLRQDTFRSIGKRFRWVMLQRNCNIAGKKARKNLKISRWLAPTEFSANKAWKYSSGKWTASTIAPPRSQVSTFRIFF